MSNFRYECPTCGNCVEMALDINTKTVRCNVCNANGNVGTSRITPLDQGSFLNLATGVPPDIMLVFADHADYEEEENPDDGFFVVETFGEAVKLILKNAATELKEATLITIEEKVRSAKSLLRRFITW